MNAIQGVVRGGAVLSVVVGAASVWAPSSATSAGAVTQRVNVSSTGAQANGASSGVLYSVLSGDGKVVVFQSKNPKIVHGDTNRAADIFVRSPVS